MREQTQSFPATLSSCEPIRNWVMAFMTAAQLSSEQVYNFQVAVDEHIANLIEHAFPQVANPIIEIACREDERQAQIIIAEASAGFDPRQFSIPDVEGRPIYEIPPGGFGNYFICELMDDVQYIHRPYERNELILTIYKD
jgi:anti-sigma regulatory factor (Ser/Thr protein kinase)